METLSHETLFHLLLALAVLLAGARLMGELAARFRQPAILGEILAGILLGPTVLGNLAPGFQRFLFPAEPGFQIGLEAITTLSIVLFLLVAGLEVDLSTAWRQGRTAVTVALSAMAVPFSIAFAAAYLFPGYLGATADLPIHVFALFMGTALSICALPVIIKTLMDLNLFKTEVGVIVLSAAIIIDLIGWNLFAIVLSFAGVESREFGVGTTVALTLGFVLIMLTVGRFVMDKTLPWVQAHFTFPGGVLGFSLSGALLCAAFTEWIGIHGIFGAFIFGVALGDSDHLRARTRATLEQFISFIFAPLFFASIGLRIDFLAHFDLLLTVSVCVIASAGMIAGGTTGARLCKVAPRESLAIGVALNARGAMEIILGLLALQAGIIGERLFVALVVMALVTSVASGVLIPVVLRRRKTTKFYEYIPSHGFVAKLGAGEVREAIEELTALACQNLPIDTEKATAMVWRRERLIATGLENGIAVPHARMPGLKSPVIVVGVSESGIDFNAQDGQPAKVIFLILTPEEDMQLHLEVLRDIAVHFSNANLAAQAAETPSLTAFRSLLKSAEHGT